jgi:hypothetical protein
MGGITGKAILVLILRNIVFINFFAWSAIDLWLDTRHMFLEIVLFGKTFD